MEENKYCDKHYFISNKIKDIEVQNAKLRSDLMQVKILLTAIALLIFGGYL